MHTAEFTVRIMLEISKSIPDMVNCAGGLMNQWDCSARSAVCKAQILMEVGLRIRVWGGEGDDQEITVPGEGNSWSRNYSETFIPQRREDRRLLFTHPVQLALFPICGLGQTQGISRAE